jgi:hypothetical protein
MQKIILTFMLTFVMLSQTLAFNISREITKISDEEFQVKIHFENMNIKGYANISETIPSGFTVIEGNSNGGGFSFRKNNMKILWLSFPPQANFEIDYTIKVSGDVNSTTLNGVFGYIENDNKSTMNLSPGKIPYALATEEVAIAETPVVEETISEKAPVKKEPKPVYADNSSSTSGITYHVQIGALTNPNFEFSSSVRSLAPIERKKHGSIYRYLSGSFTSRADAMSLRTKLVNTGISGAFVVKYKDGKRI